MGAYADPTQLIASVQAGDSEARDALQAIFDRAVRGYVWARVYRKEDVEDVLQDARVRLWQTLHQYDASRGSFTAFARNAVARSAVRDYLSALDKYGHETPYPGGPGDDEEGSTEPPTPARGAAEAGDAAATREINDDMLRLVFGTRSPPHQLFAFGFCKLLEWKPQQVMDELSDVPLRELMPRLVPDLAAELGLAPEEVDSCLQLLAAALECVFEQVVEERRTLQTYPRLRQQVVGETTLRDYYRTTEPTADIEHWWQAVRRRSVTELSRRQAGPAADWLGSR